MNSQPNEIITHILSYLDNYTLMFARSTCHKWKNLIETRIFYKKNIPALHVCIMTDDYYHFGKYYLDYNYDTNYVLINVTVINYAGYYDNLITIPPNKKIFRRVIPVTNKILSKDLLLIYASSRGHLEVVKYLISMGANIHVDNDAALQWSVQMGYFEVVKYLISMGADLHVDSDAALRWSAGKGHLEVVKYLIDIGADLHAETDFALRCSAENGHLEVVKYLISMGADLHAENDWILKYGAPNIIEYLKYISGKN